MSRLSIIARASLSGWAVFLAGYNKASFMNYITFETALTLPTSYTVGFQLFSFVPLSQGFKYTYLYNLKRGKVKASLSSPFWP